MIRRVAVAAVLPLLVSGCAAFSDEGSSTADDGELTVVASFYPLQFLSERIVGDLGTVTALTQPGQEPHDLEMPPAQTVEVAEADLVVFESDLQPAVDDAVERVAQGVTVDAADAADLLPSEDGHDHAEEDHAEEEHAEEHAEDEHDHAHAEETEAAEEHTEEGHDGHDHGASDPHFWHDPLRMAAVAEAIAEGLGEVDPDHAEDYTANAADVVADLEALDQEYAAGLASCERDTVVVSHDAFAYLERYGLHFEPIAGLSPDAEPTAADLAHLHEVIEAEGITTVFSERLVPAELSETLANDAGVTTAVLDPVEGLTEETSEEDYFTLMRANLAALMEANGCQ